MSSNHLTSHNTDHPINIKKISNLTHIIALNNKIIVPWYRLDSSLRSGLNSLDERQLHQELSSSKAAIRQWSQLLEQNNLLDRQLAAIAQGKGPESLTASNNSLASIG